MSRQIMTANRPTAVFSNPVPGVWPFYGEDVDGHLEIILKPSNDEPVCLPVYGAPALVSLLDALDFRHDPKTVILHDPLHRIETVNWNLRPHVTLYATKIITREGKYPDDEIAVWQHCYNFSPSDEQVSALYGLTVQILNSMNGEYD